MPLSFRPLKLVILLKRDFEVSTKSGVNSYDCANHKRLWIFLGIEPQKWTMNDGSLTPNRNGEGTPDWHPSPSISVDPAIPGGLLPSRARFTGYHKIRNGRKECKRSSQRADNKE
jgi:hypothetical protein